MTLDAIKQFNAPSKARAIQLGQELVANIEKMRRLHLPMFDDETAIITSYIQKGADLHQKSVSGRTPLMSIAHDVHLELCKKIIQRDITTLQDVSPWGGTALSFCILNNQPKLTQELLNQGADHTVLDNKGQNLLQIAYIHKSDKAKEVLEKWMEAENEQNRQKNLLLAKQAVKDLSQGIKDPIQRKRFNGFKSPKVK